MLKERVNQKIMCNGKSKTHIVVLSTEYSGFPTANGICARNLVTQLEQMGHSVDVICSESKENNVREGSKIYTFKRPKASHGGFVSKVFHKIKTVIRMLSGNAIAMMNRDLIRAYWQKLEEVNRTSPIDTVIAMFFSIESVEALARFKQEHPSVFAVSYELDSIGDGISQQSAKHRIAAAVYEKWLQKKYSVIDRIIVMKSHDSYWKEKFGLFSAKMQTADIPVLLPSKDNDMPELYKKCTMVYSGLIEKAYRSPTYLLSVLSELNKRLDFDFLFFSKGDCETEIANAAAENPSIRQMGFVTPEELGKAVDRSHFLISIGNSVSRSLPSKLISYIAAGKPIIHFSSQKDDICREYLKNYPMGLIVNQDLPCAEACRIVCRFVKENLGKSIGFNEVREKFIMNDPAYSAKLICDISNKT